MAALTAEVFAALQSLLKASSKDVVRQLCQESFSSSALGSKKLLDVTCSSLSVTQEEAEQGSPSVLQLLQALHRLTRLVVFRDLSSAEAILALFPENFHQNLKNLLTKIILEHVSTWRAEAQTNQKACCVDHTHTHVQPLELPVVEERLSNAGGVSTEPSCPHTVSLPRLVDLDWRVDIKTSSDSISRMAVPTCLLQMKCSLFRSRKIPVCVGSSPPCQLSLWS
ncbi:COMM domain-containing protein 9 isoform X3 [Tursiops truncatus]|uniref:COMM domain-containing protein 9 isoform X3 n=1 Tax=Tursiops truncatus TaxID=9739 RepID=A0A2U4CF08_TURTR|nr:COMM domain-containing protein 9 isoform X3 [Tursiops truncatus]XP_030720545.1 COMM domain-containing protein 9 isoform X3 [Globicephala melas]